MQIYLPIAEVSANILALLMLGGATGILSGLFGIGGGFLTTPILIFMGIPPTVAVASTANQIVAAGFTGFRAHLKRQNVDFKMGNLLLIGGLGGSTCGVELFQLLEQKGQIDLVISLSYVIILGVIGILMAAESSQEILRKERKTIRRFTLHKHKYIERLPFKIAFPHSQLEISAIMPILIGFMVGLMVPIMGVGGGFFMIPAMIYLLGMPTAIVIGTSLYQVVFITANATFLHAVKTQSVDIVLALILVAGSVVGAQYGTRLASYIPPEKLRGFMAIMVLILALKLAYGLLATPNDFYSVSVVGE